MIRSIRLRFALPVLCAFAMPMSASAAMTDDAATALLDASKCLKCHSVDKKKDGPSYKDVAAKYKGKPDAMAKLTKHVTEPSKVEIDGEKEDHGAVKTRDPEKVKGLVEWILSR